MSGVAAAPVLPESIQLQRHTCAALPWRADAPPHWSNTPSAIATVAAFLAQVLA